MPSWWVSQPYISIHVEDEPLGYQPARGKRVAFRLSYRQRGDMPYIGSLFAVGNDWSCSFKSYVFIDSQQNNRPTMHRGGAGAEYFVPDGGNWRHSRTKALWASGTGWYRVDHGNGAQSLFSTTWTYGGVTYYLLTTYTDPHGNAIQYGYTSTPSGGLHLTTVTDPDGTETIIHYDSANFPDYITRVEDPFGRTCYLSYDEYEYSESYGCLTNIVDVIGMTNGFAYGASPQRWMTNMITPYGTTSFRHSGNDANTVPENFAGGNVVNRLLEVTEPNGSHQLFLYRRDCSGIMNGTRSDVPNPQGLANTFDNVDVNQRNSFHWDRLQYAQLNSNYRQSGNWSDLTADDYKVGRLSHWLAEDTSSSFGDVLSLTREPRPDANTTEGLVTWFDYEGKPANNARGTFVQPLFVAINLPDGTNRFTRSARNAYGLPTQEIASWTKTDGVVAMRTNTFTYAANTLDLTRHVGPEGEQVVSNWFNNVYHQPDRSYNALNEETIYAYDGTTRQPKSVTRPTGLVTTYAYNATTRRMTNVVDEPIHRTNSYTHYANGFVSTHTDERGLKTTNYWDNLQRLTGTADSGGSTTNLYSKLDLVCIVDRMGYSNRYAYSEIRQRTAETNANGVVTR